MTDPFSILDEQQASEAKSEVDKQKADAIHMIEEMSDAAFECWYTAACPAMYEAWMAKSNISTAALIDAPEDVFNEWMREDEREIDAHSETEVRPYRFPRTEKENPF